MANLEPGDVLLLAATLTAAPMDILQDLGTAAADSPSYRAALASATSLAYATFDVVGSGVVIEDLTSGQRIHPTGAFPAPGAPDDLILQWNGFQTEPPLAVSTHSVAMTTAANLAQVFPANRPDFPLNANAIGVDKAGPLFAPLNGAATSSILSIVRAIEPSLPPFTLTLYPNPDGPGYLNEVIAGDIVTVSAGVQVRADLDGEGQLNGDALSRNDFIFDANRLEGAPREGGPVQQGFLRVENGQIVQVDEPVAGEAFYFAAAVVAGMTDIVTQGDYSDIDLYLMVRDDVGQFDWTDLTVRADTLPPILEDLVVQTNSARTVQISGQPRPLLIPGDQVRIRIVVGLNGDPVDAPSAVLLDSSIRPGQPEVNFPGSPVVLDDQRVQFEISTTVAENAPLNANATVGVRIRDDAGNAVTADSADFGYVFVVDVVPTPTPLPPNNGDLDNNGVVDRSDLFQFVRDWLDFAVRPGERGDQVPDSDREINPADLLHLWNIMRNPTPVPTPTQTPTPVPTPTHTPTPTG